MSVVVPVTPAGQILILGDLELRPPGGELTAYLAETLIVLAACGRPLTRRELGAALYWGPTDEAVEQYLTRLRKLVPIASTGPRGRMRYAVDQERCRIDAQEFVRGVAAGRPAGPLLRLWRGPVPAGVLDTTAWASIEQARRQLVRRIADLPEAELPAAEELERFGCLFPGDEDAQAIRPGVIPRLLVVDDDPAMITEITEQLKDDYKITPITEIGAWRQFRDQEGSLAQVDGALIDLHLTPDLDDQRGLQIVEYLRDHTEIPTALVTANGMERSSTANNRRRAEFRLVDIVDKKNNDWWKALEQAARLLTGTGDPERRHRLETWLETAYLKFKRHTRDAPRGSINADRRRACDADYAKVIGIVRTADIEEAQAQVRRFRTSWPASR